MKNLKTNKSSKCKLCGNSSNLKHEGFQGYQLGLKFNIYACDNCSTSFSMPRVNTDKIYDAIYNNGENVPGYNRYWHYKKQVKLVDNPLHFLANSEEAFWGIQQSLNRLVPNKENSEILELGSGLGYLTYALKHEGYNIHGLDISSTAVEQAKKSFGDFYVCRDLHDFAIEKPGSYDIVILTEVIEHIEKPIDFIKSILKLLKKGGHIIITTPNKSLIPSDIIWDSEAPPIHHWWFSEESMNYIAATLNLEIDFINFSEYYFNHPEEYKTAKRKKRIERIPILNDQGELIRNSEYIPDHISQDAQLKKANTKRKLLKLKATFNPNIIVFDKRGKTMCAILSK